MELCSPAAVVAFDVAQQPPWLRLARPQYRPVDDIDTGLAFVFVVLAYFVRVQWFVVAAVVSACVVVRDDNWRIDRCPVKEENFGFRKK